MGDFTREPLLESAEPLLIKGAMLPGRNGNANQGSAFMVELDGLAHWGGSVTPSYHLDRKNLGLQEESNSFSTWLLLPAGLSNSASCPHHPGIFFTLIPFVTWLGCYSFKGLISSPTSLIHPFPFLSLLSTFCLIPLAPVFSLLYPLY